nr:hypothetical protein CFP56_50502 [Quercus suber]POF20067.1 hypothetical protein CFP56_52316 [Quercus suber]
MLLRRSVSTETRIQCLAYDDPATNLPRQPKKTTSFSVIGDPGASLGQDRSAVSIPRDQRLRTTVDSEQRRSLTGGRTSAIEPGVQEITWDGVARIICPVLQGLGRQREAGDAALVPTVGVGGEEIGDVLGVEVLDVRRHHAADARAIVDVGEVAGRARGVDGRRAGYGRCGGGGTGGGCHGLRDRLAFALHPSLTADPVSVVLPASEQDGSGCPTPVEIRNVGLALLDRITSIVAVVGRAGITCGGWHELEQASEEAVDSLTPFNIEHCVSARGFPASLITVDDGTEEQQSEAARASRAPPCGVPCWSPSPNRTLIVIPRYRSRHAPHDETRAPTSYIRI